MAQEGLQLTVWVGFLAIILVGIGPGIALQAVRRGMQWEKDQP
jgi:hypothetical protein